LAAVHERFAAGEMHVITATSLEVGRNLLDMATPELRGEFERVHWLVPGERIAAGLRELGMQAPLLQAESADDQDLVTALIRWRSSVSGA
jgi:uroporphyrinogen-III synthase